MRISVIGCGYLGAVHAVCLASLGHQVVGVDVDAGRIAALAAGVPPFFEPGFAELLAEVSASGRLSFSTELSQAADAEVHFICVGTPQLDGSGRADLSYLDQAAAGLAEVLADHRVEQTVVVGKSTVPVGTAARLAAGFDQGTTAVTLIWNPEFLREGFAVHDSLHPDRIVYGLPPGAPGKRAAAILDAVYAPILAAGDATPKVETDWATAELVKVAANSFLATKISFINAMAEVCDSAGGNVLDLARAIGLDERIGPKFLRAGIGFGGGCLPKDLRAFAARAGELGVDSVADLLGQVDRINLAARRRLMDLIQRTFDDLTGRRIACLGAAFKPDSDDTRDSPALDIALRLHQASADVVVYDPQVDLAKVAPQLEAASSLVQAAWGAEALVVLTEWREFIDLDPAAVSPLVAKRLIIDGRNALAADRWRQAGWTYLGLGRP